MEDTEIINLWKSYDKKLEENLHLNIKNTEDITKMKVKSLLYSMRPIKIFAILVGILWVGFVDVLIFKLFTIASPFFLISAIIHVLITKMAIGIYLYQLILIHQVDINHSILKTQTKLASLKATTLWVARLLFLQLPVWTIFYWSKSMLQNGNIWLYMLQFTITASLIYIAIWLFIHIKFENRNKKWFRLIFNGIEWNPMIKSMEILNHIEDFRMENNA